MKFIISAFFLAAIQIASSKQRFWNKISAATLACGIPLFKNTRNNLEIDNFTNVESNSIAVNTACQGNSNSNAFSSFNNINNVFQN